MCISAVSKRYNATGIVLGNLWGGGMGTYPSEKLSNYSSVEELLEDAEKMLKTGALDSGMGFQNLIGAGLIIEEFKTIKYNNESFYASNDSQVYIGNMNQDELQILEEQINTI